MPDTGQRQAGQEEVDSEHDPGMRKEAHSINCQHPIPAKLFFIMESTLQYM